MKITVRYPLQEVSGVASPEWLKKQQEDGNVRLEPDGTKTVLYEITSLEDVPAVLKKIEPIEVKYIDQLDAESIIIAGDYMDESTDTRGTVVPKSQSLYIEIMGPTVAGVKKLIKQILLKQIVPTRKFVSHSPYDRPE